MKGTNRPLHEIFEEQARPSGEEVADRDTCGGSNLRRALQRTGLRRPTLDAELFAGYARRFAQRGWILAPPRRTRGDLRGRDPGWLASPCGAGSRS